MSNNSTNTESSSALYPVLNSQINVNYSAENWISIAEGADRMMRRVLESIGQEGTASLEEMQSIALVQSFFADIRAAVRDRLWEHV